jgi:coenzyme PQQ synthesis protein D (PqqD)
VHNSPRTKHYPRARPDLTFRSVEGQFALTDRAGTHTERLSLVAALVWTYCDGRHDPDTIADAVARDLPEAGHDVQARVTALLAQFASQGMVS